ncbi:unnamed protein product [Penicillium egyptiacum]|uniref:Coenzyme Q-binding protein COQ10 START domain-containing protein n=1 Tax=Penicillium egyptiacum TaxID=1303716 RepID=A0A9W4KDK7_9EURO|nr:unnamed protein product [Penicillium egyptiacum]
MMRSTEPRSQIPIHRGTGFLPDGISKTSTCPSASLSPCTPSFLHSMRRINTLRHTSRTSRTIISPRSQISASSLRPATKSISTTPCPRPRQAPLTQSCPSYTTHRSFNLSALSSFLPSTPSGNNNSDPKRVLTATRTLPFSPGLLFEVISSVESYSQFLPFLTASTVTARDPESGYPTQAFLTVGFGPFSETFTSKVDCDPVKATVEARSGAKYGQSALQSDSSKGGLSGFFPGANEGIFEYLNTRWELVPLASVDAQGGPQTKVNLEVRFEFRNQMHATIMSAVEGQMASVMIEAFEKRIRETHTKGQ